VINNKLVFFSFIVLIFSFSKAQTLKECDEMIIEGVTELNNKNHVKSIELLTLVQSISEKNSWYKQEFLATNNIGLNYYMLLDYGEALDHYLEAYKIALKNLDPNFEMIVLNNIAILYSKEKNYTKAEEYFLKAFNIAKESNDSLKIGFYATNLASVANETKQLEKAQSYLKTAIPRLQNVPNILIIAKVIQAQNLLLNKDFSESKKNILSILPELQKTELSEHRISAWMILSEIYENEKNIDWAIKYAKLVGTDKNASIENKIDSYNRLTELYRFKNDNSTAFLYKDSAMIAKDSLNQIKNGKLFENSRIKFELQNYQKELSESQQKLASERKTFYMILAIALVFIMIVLWALRSNSVKLKQRKIIAENNQKITKLELEKEKYEKLILEQQLEEQSTKSKLKEEKFKNEIETKNRQLASKAISISARNELIESIIESLAKESEIKKNEGLKRQIFELKNLLKKESEWDEFFTHFDETNDGFLSALKEKHIELSSNDIRFLSYVYMNLSTKEISSLLNITVEACRKRKERIIKKMNLPENENLYDYLSAI